MGDQEIMEYSAIHADQNEDDPEFQSGGAMLDALAETDPGFKNMPQKSSSKKVAPSKSKK